MKVNEAKEVTDVETSVITSMLLEIIEDDETKEKYAKIIKVECHRKNLMTKKRNTRINNIQENMGIKDAEHSLIASKLIKMIRDKENIKKRMKNEFYKKDEEIE